MQTITPLTIGDFEKTSIITISKVEIDIDGAGDFQELPDVKTCNVKTNEENRVAKFCSHSFSIVCLNTDDRYGSLNSGSSYYGWLKQGRRIKLWAGIKNDGSEYFYQYILGRIDIPKLSTKSGEKICTITGRCLMRMLLEYKLYFPNTYWGTDISYNTVANQMTYGMEADCKGIYKVELDSTSPYDGSNLEEIFEGRDWTYDWNQNKLVFVSRKAPDFAGTNNLKVYYYQTQNVEDVVGDILLDADILADAAARTAWLASGYCTATGETIDRVWFNTATRASKAITLLSEVVQYRLNFDYEGNPIFRPKSSKGAAVNNIEYTEMKNLEENQSIDEVYTHVIVIGESRDRVVGDDETAPAVPTSLALFTGFGEYTQAGLAYVKATWDANTESDFGHYELRIKKNADSDYTEVSTIATSYMFLGLEPGVTYNVQIRACDIYENRSNWSSAENQTTATDSSTPAQTTGQTATAVVAGIKIEWTKNSEDNISYYLVERQESPDNVDWSAGWVEITRINGDMWLDLLLTYSKYYRYRITAYTVAGVAGTTSANTTAVQPSQVDTNDVAADAITAVEIDVIDLAAIKADLGSITAGDITLDSNGFIRTSEKTSYADTDAGFWLGYDTTAYKLNIGDASHYLKWDGTTLDIQGNLKVGGTGSNNEIYFKDSGIYLYDFVAGGGANTTGVSFKNSTTKFFVFWNHPTNKNTYLRMYGDDTAMDSYTGIRTLGEAGSRYTQIVGYYSSKYSYIKLIPTTTTDTLEFQGTGSTDRIINIIKGTNTVFIKATATSGEFRCTAGGNYDRIYMYPHATDGSGFIQFLLDATSPKFFTMYNNGIFNLPNLSSNPSTGANGAICVVNGVLKSYQSGAWKTVTVS